MKLTSSPQATPAPAQTAFVKDAAHTVVRLSRATIVRLTRSATCRGVLLALPAVVQPGSFARGQITSPPSVSQAHPAQAPDAAVQLKSDPARAEQAYLAGARLVDHHDLPAAQAQFARAVDLNPAQQTYVLALSLTRQQRVSDLIQQAAEARLAGHSAEADQIIAEAARVDPASEQVREHQAARSGQSPAAQPQEVGFAPPIVLIPSLGAQTIDLRGDLRQVITQVGTRYGIRSVFDESVPDQPVRFNAGAGRFDQLMPVLLKMGHLFAVPLDAKSQFVVSDTQENRKKFARQVEETIFIPATGVEQMNELVNIIKNIFDVTSVAASPRNGTLAIRAPESTIKPLNYTLATLVDSQPDVVVELKLFSVDRSRTRNTGVQTPTSIGAFSVAAEARSLVSANQDVINQAIASGALTLTGNVTQDLLQEAAFLILGGFATDARLANLVAIFGHGLTLFGVNLGSNATVNLALNSSDSRALDDLTTRLGDHQTTTLRIGSKYPVITSTFSSGLSNSTAALLQGKTINGVSASQLLSQFGGAGSSAVTPTITFEDLGVTLKTTPTILKSSLVGLHLDMKIEALTGASLDNIPVLASRAFVSDILVNDGETAVLLSNLSRTEAASISGIPGLADLPGFRDTAADHLAEASSSELVVLVTPHIVHRRTSVIASRVVPFTTFAPQEF